MTCANYQERKAIVAALKPIYNATNDVEAERALDAFEDSELGHRCPVVVRNWHAKWSLATPFLVFWPPVQKMPYTINSIESLNSSVPRAVKARGHFTSEGATRMLIYLALRQPTAKWTAPLGC